MTLIDRLSKLDGPDREVDAEIAAHFRIGDNLHDWAKSWKGEWKPTIHGYVVLMESSGSPGPNFRSQEYTGSLDAVTALARRLYPDVMYRVGNHAEGYDPSLYLGEIFFCGDKRDSYLTGVASTDAIALCIALLRAKEASNA